MIKSHRSLSFAAALAIVAGLLVHPAPTPAATPAWAGSYVALVIGNDVYRDRAFPALHTAVIDANAVAEALKTRFGFDAKVLHNATRAQILDALTTYRRTLDEKSNLLVFYAGHGWYDKAVDEAYWIPVDGQDKAPYTWVSANDITKSFKAIPSKHILLVSDSCYSGMIQGGDTRSADVRIDPIQRQRYIAKLNAEPSRNVMASGGNEPVADGGGRGGHSVFAGALLRGLEDYEPDTFTAEELFYLRIKPLVAGRAEQVPQYSYIRNSGHELGDFVFLRTTAAMPAATAAPVRVAVAPIDNGAPRVAPAPSSASFERGKTALNARNYAEAISSFEQAVQGAPQDPEAHVYLGYTYELQSRYPEADSQYREAIRLNSRAPLYHLRLGVSSWLQKHYADAEREYRAAIALAPTVADYHNRLGVALESLNKLTEAQNEYREAVRLDPNLAVAKMNLASFTTGSRDHWLRALESFNKKDYAKAEPEFQAAAALLPTNATYLRAYCDDLYRQKKYAEAETPCRSALALEKSAESYDMLGVVLNVQNKSKEAEELHRASVAIRPNNAASRYNLAEALFRQKRYAEAVPEFRVAVQHDPNNAIYRFEFGYTLYSNGNYEEAESELRTALRLQPNPPAYFHRSLGYALSAQHRYAESEVEYKEALRLEPNAAVNHVSLADAAFNQSRFAEAESGYRTAIRLDPNQAYIHDYLGNALYRQGKNREAEAEYREALRIDPNYAPAQADLNRLQGAVQ